MMSGSTPTMTRQDAIERIARHELEQLDVAERESIIQDFWTIREDDPDYATLGDDLKIELSTAEGTEHPEHPRYDALILAAFRHDYIGTVNAYLEQRLEQVGEPKTKVEGVVEQLFTCPCCGYRTLDGRGDYDVCKVCYWEDDNTNDPACRSSPNHMTLGEARRRFATLGTIFDDGHRSKFAHEPSRYEGGSPNAAQACSESVPCAGSFRAGNVKRSDK
jgi:hypothetical protein